MKFETSGRTLKAGPMEELSTINCDAFVAGVRSALMPDHEVIEVDLSDARFLDSRGISALVSLKKLLQPRQGIVRLLRPEGAVLRVLQLTQMDRLFEIVH